MQESNDIYWAQRAKVKWQLKGDRNTAYFHALSVQRGKHNLITSLQDDEGVWHADSRSIHILATNFYKELFTSQTEGIIPLLGHLQMPMISGTMLDMRFTKEDVKKSVFLIQGNKSPGPDGMPGIFFQHYWEALGPKVCTMVLDCVNEGIFLSKFNFTSIYLIPKVMISVNLTQFRPIALCNVIAKLVAKVLATRLKSVLPNIISDSQNAFVPRRLITDNVLMAFEAHHFIKNQKTGTRGHMSIKLDMLKAYDRIKWSFLKEMMIKLNFSIKWVTLIMLYPSSVTYSVLINWEQTGIIRPGRRLRQGDPLSPYLFILCTEGFIALIKDAVLRGNINGIELGAGVETLSHLMFADHTLLLGVATVEEALCFKEKVKHRIVDWKSKLLSKAEKKVFINAVLQSIPTNAMQYFQGLKTFARKYILLLQAIGFKDMHHFNQALLYKQVWRILTELKSPLASFVIRTRPDEKGCQWKIGDGKKVKIWQVPWLTHTWSHGPITPAPQGLHQATIAELIDEITGTWNQGKIREWFYDIDSEQILKIPINNLNHEDSIIRSHNPRGLFIVKSTYSFIHSLSLSSSSETNMHVFNTCKFTKEVSKELMIAETSDQIREFHILYKMEKISSGSFCCMDGQFVAYLAPKEH
ncbi:hypothetical protein LIER_06523 [Lithospermum erythrorhizon]|uniref:Reverse transcriptase domain-containing protein n=1 Tax=Lithospermum erythrorhizon TaxID=34254 RepID=A0AAV3P4U5_LITER